MNDDPKIPAALQSVLKQEFCRPIEVSADFDAAILAAAGKTIVHRRWRRRTLRVAGAGAAIAAAACVVVALRPHIGLPPRSPARQIAQRDDLDGNGRVDILDAFYLAKRLNDSGKPRAWDMNNDGKIDQADVDAIAASAVRVGGTS